MIWNRRKRGPSAEATACLETSKRELTAAKALRAEAAEVGMHLTRSRELNHFGLALELAVKGQAR